jgi:hypothetical protein
MKATRSLVCILFCVTLILACVSGPATGDREPRELRVVRFIMPMGCG